VSQNLGKGGGYVRLEKAFSKDHGELSKKFGRGLHITLPEDKRSKVFIVAYPLFSTHSFISLLVLYGWV
jgi:hypothetical protein